MIVTRRLALSAAALLSLAATVPAAAQVPGAPAPPSLGIHIGVKATTLGFGPEVGIGIGPRLGFRAGLNVLSMGREFDWDGIGYSVDLKFRTITGLLDLYLLGPIRLSGGLAINNNKLQLSADPTVSVQIGNTLYQATDVGTITGTIDYSKKTAPYLGLGIGGRGRIGFILEAGMLFTGSPRLTYTATTTLTGPAATAFQQQVTTETGNVQADLNNTSVLKTYPVVGLGLQVKI